MLERDAPSTSFGETHKNVYVARGLEAVVLCRTAKFPLLSSLLIMVVDAVDHVHMYISKMDIYRKPSSMF